MQDFNREGPESYRWLVGRQIDRIGQAFFERHPPMTLGLQINVLEALAFPVCEASASHQKRWKALHEDIPKGHEPPLPVRHGELRLLIQALWEGGVLTQKPAPEDSLPAGGEG